MDRSSVRIPSRRQAAAQNTHAQEPQRSVAKGGSGHSDKGPRMIERSSADRAHKNWGERRTLSRDLSHVQPDQITIHARRVDPARRGRAGVSGSASQSRPKRLRLRIESNSPPVWQSYAAHRSAGEHDLAGRSWLENLLVRAHRIGEQQFLADNGPQGTVFEARKQPGVDVRLFGRCNGPERERAN